MNNGIQKYSIFCPECLDPKYSQSPEEAQKELCGEFSYKDDDFTVKEYRTNNMVNHNSDAVKIIHNPTGLSACHSGERSQHKNEQLAKEKLIRKIEEAKNG